jgi:putative ABC transport system permease protein
VSPLLGRAGRRFYLRHPWQLVLAITGIALGVAVYIGVALANDSARRAFEESVETIRGRTTHRLLPVGGELDDGVYAALVTGGRVTEAAPVVEAVLRIAGPDGIRVSILGIDPIEETGFRTYTGFVPGSGADFGRLVTEPDTVLVPEALARDLDVGIGDSIELWRENSLRRVEIVGTVEELAAGADTSTPLIADISTAQELLGRVGRLSRIDLRLTPAQAIALGRMPPPGTALVDVDDQGAALTQMTDAFQTNLTALGLLALVVGMFLIYATISFALVQRRQTIGMLRAIGVGRRLLLATVLAEAAAIGAVGTAAGLVLGDLLARGLVEMVLATIGDLYFSSAVAPAAPSPWIYVHGAVLGLGATLIAAAWPALEAARTAPDSMLRRAALERATHARAVRAAWLAAPAIALAALLLAISEHSLVLAFAALFFVLAAGAMATPLATVGLMRLVEPLVGRLFALPGLMAVRGVGASLSRTGVATAALAVAVATVVGVGLMIGSFRVSLVAWLDTTLTADLYLQVGDADDVDVDALSALPGVAGVEVSRFVRLPTAYGTIGIRAQQPGPEGWGLAFVNGAVERAEAALTDSDAVVVAEAFAYRYGLGAGDSVELSTADGPEAFRVVGIYRNYDTGGSAFVMSLDTYRRHWDDARITGIGLHLERRADRDAVATEVRRAVGGAAALRSTEAIERISLEVFDRTFKITEVLRFLAGVVAFLGVVSALLAIELERSREVAILASLGFPPFGLATQTLTRSGLLGIAAGFAAVPLGVVLAALLVYVINRRSFGWTMELDIAPAPIAAGIGLAFGAALLAGVYPAARAARGRLEAGLHDE